MCPPPVSTREPPGAPVEPVESELPGGGFSGASLGSLSGALPAGRALGALLGAGYEGGVYSLEHDLT